MKLRSSLNCLSVLLFSMSVSASANVREEQTDTVKESKAPYIAHYAGKGDERIVVNYQAIVYDKIWQTGDSFSLKDRHLKDDRACHIEIRAWVARRAFIISLSGVHAPIEDYNQVWSLYQTKDNEASNPIEGLTYHATCGEGKVWSDYHHRIDKVKQDLAAAFDGMVAKDDDANRQHLSALLHATLEADNPAH